MKKKLLYLTALTVLIPLISCEETLSEKIYNHEVGKYKTWQKWQAWEKRAIEERIFEAPNNLIDFLRLDNSNQNYAEQPEQISNIDSQLKLDINQALIDIPQVVKNKINNHLVGIFVVKNLGSTAMFIPTYENNKIRGGLIVINYDALYSRNANQWASWRDLTAFKDNNKAINLNLTLEDEKNNNRKNAIQFILLHEIGHLTDFLCACSWTTSREKSTKKILPLFFSWDLNGSLKKSIYDDWFQERENIHFYKKDSSSLDLIQAKEIYSKLLKTSFVSLYSIISHLEDFAESYAVYVHTVLMQKPYKLEIHSNQVPIFNYEQPYQSKRMQEKKAYFDKLFKKLIKTD